MKMKYTIELTNKQKALLESLLEIVRKHIGFNVTLEPMEIVPIKDTQAYKQGYEDGYCRGIKDTQDSLYSEVELKEEYERGLKDARQTMLELLKIPSSERGKMFGNDDYYYTQIILEHFSIEEINDRIKAYKEKQNAEKYHLLVTTLRTVTDEYPRETIVSALSEFGITAESEG